MIAIWQYRRIDNMRLRVLNPPCYLRIHVDLDNPILEGPE